MATQTGRPIAPARKLVAAVSGTIAIFVVALGFGMSNLGVVVFGIALLALSVALGMVNVVRRGARAWVAGTAEVRAVSPPPASTSVYGRARIQAVVVAPGLPTSEVEINESRVPVVKWPEIGDTLPVTVDVDDMRRVRINWDEAVPRERGEDPPPPMTGYDETAPIDDDLDADLLGDVEPPPWTSRDRVWGRGPDEPPPPPPPGASPPPDGTPPPGVDDYPDTVVVRETPDGKVVEGEFVDHDEAPSPLPRRAASRTSGVPPRPGGGAGRPAADPSRPAGDPSRPAGGSAHPAGDPARPAGDRPSPRPRGGGTATATAEPQSPPAPREPHPDDVLLTDIPLDEPTAGSSRRPEPTPAAMPATPSPVGSFPSAPPPSTPPPTAPEPATPHPAATPAPAPRRSHEDDEIDVPLDVDPDPAPEATPEAEPALRDDLIAPPPPTPAAVPPTTRFVSNAAHDATAPTAEPPARTGHAPATPLGDEPAGHLPAAPAADEPVARTRATPGGDQPAGHAPAPAGEEPAGRAAATDWVNEPADYTRRDAPLDPPPAAGGAEPQRRTDEPAAYPQAATRAGAEPDSPPAPAEKSSHGGLFASAVGAVAAAAAAAVRKVGRSEREDRPTQERPDEERPTQDRPDEDRPARDRPTPDRPAQQRPAEERPAREQPTSERASAAAAAGPVPPDRATAQAPDTMPTDAAAFPTAPSSPWARPAPTPAAQDAPPPAIFPEDEDIPPWITARSAAAEAAPGVPGRAASTPAPGRPPTASGTSPTDGTPAQPRAAFEAEPVAFPSSSAPSPGPAPASAAAGLPAPVPAPTSAPAPDAATPLFEATPASDDPEPAAPQRIVAVPLPAPAAATTPGPETPADHNPEAPAAGTPSPVTATAAPSAPAAERDRGPWAALAGTAEPDEHAADLITAYPSARPGPAGAIHGVGITVLVTDLDRSTAFYRGTLGFHEIDRGGGSAVLASGDTRLVLRTVQNLAAEAGRLIFLNLEVGDVEAVYEELRAKGVDFVHAPRPVNRGDRLELWSATFRDPDDHNIAITQWRAVR